MAATASGLEAELIPTVPVTPSTSAERLGSWIEVDYMSRKLRKSEPVRFQRTPAGASRQVSEPTPLSRSKPGRSASR